MLEAGRRHPLIITNSSSGGLTPPAALLPTHERQLKGSRINLILSELQALLPTSGCYIYYRPQNLSQNFLLKTDALSANLVCPPRSWLAGDMYLFASQIFWAEILDWKRDSWGARQWIRGDITVTGCHRETPPTCWIAALCENVKINLTQQNCCTVSYVHALYTRLLWQNNWLLYPSNYWNTQYTIYTLYTLQQYLDLLMHCMRPLPRHLLWRLSRQITKRFPFFPPPQLFSLFPTHFPHSFLPGLSQVAFQTMPKISHPGQFYEGEVKSW